MNNNYIKIFGQSTLDVDGELLKTFLTAFNITNAKTIPVNIVELGTFYGRHAVLWNELLKNQEVKYKYTTVDEEDYPGSHIARQYAKENISLYATGTIKSVVKQYNDEAEKHSDASIDVLHIDNVYEVAKIIQIINKWLSKISIGGYISWLVPSEDFENDISYINMMNELKDKGFALDKYKHLAYAKKISPVMKEKIPNKVKSGLDKSDHIVEKSNKQEVV